MRTLTGLLLVGVASVVALQPAALAQTYPTKPVHVISAYAAGGPTDLIARPVLQYLSATMGQQFILQNRPGANGNIGANEVVRAAPDGYTLLFATTSQLTINPALYSMPFDAARDLAPIIQVSMNPSSLVMNASFPAATLQEMLAHARANPGKLTFASAGIGSINHLSGELLAMLTNTKLLHVPMSGGGPAINELLAGRVDMFLVSPPLALSHVKAGKLKILMVSAPRRMSLIPDVPTMSEAGLPEFKAAGSHGMMAPGKTPPALLRRLNEEAAKYLRSPDADKQLGGQGVQIVGGTIEEFALFLRDETTRWAAVVKTGNIKVE